MAANTDPRYYCRKLTDADALAIRKAYAFGWASAAMLARKHGVTSATIFNIVQGCAYKTAGGPITWPEHPPRRQQGGRPWTVRGRCRAELCKNEIASSGWAQRMGLCDFCFKVEGGKKCGRPPSGKVRSFKCRVCGQEFTQYVKASGYRRRCCSTKCGAKFAGRNKSQRPKELTPDRLYEMYWGENKTAPEIVRAMGLRVHWTSVIFWLKQDGTPRRASNWRTYTHCIVEGCGQPRHALRQQDGRPYGRLCKAHYNEREARNARIWKQRQHEERGQELTVMIRRLLVGLPDSVRSDVEGEIVLAVLAGECALPLSRESVKPYIAAAFREYADGFGSISIDTPAPGAEDGSYTWADKLGL